MFKLIGLFSMVAAALAAMPLPFTRELKVTSPIMSGNDVVIAQNLLIRDDAVDNSLECDGSYGSLSAEATAAFQSAYKLAETGILDEETAQLLLDLHSNDNYKDSGFTAASMGYLYKLHIPVHSNRSIETTATLYDDVNNVIMKFTVRTHGHRNDGSAAPWPDFGNGDVGLNEFTSSGATVTGLIEIDLNSPEPTPSMYGPWPVNRFVRGLDGNSAFLQPNIRDGILLHTGNWTTDEVDWNPSMAMPDSSGCVHGHPSDVERVYNELVKLGVEVHENTFSGKDYPYKPQGIAVVERVD